MEQWALRAMERWPNVPALFGWLGLDRRGRWLIKGEVITRPQIIDTINGNYEADEHGRWFFQNGPQRGFVALAAAPLVLHVAGDGLITHTRKPVQQPAAAFMDEEGSLLLVTEHGPAELLATDLDWALHRMRTDGRTLDESALIQGLSLPSGARTEISLTIGTVRLPLHRLDFTAAPGALSFVREPQPRESEAVSVRVAD